MISSLHPVPIGTNTITAGAGSAIWVSPAVPSQVIFTSFSDTVALALAYELVYQLEI